MDKKNTNLPEINLIDLLEAGVHFGHKANRWNPKMSSYIFGQKNGIHVIDLRKTIPMLNKALTAVYEVAAAGGRILFVSTKKQASDIVESAAKRCGQYYVNYRWLGGMLTNWSTISQSIKRLDEVKATLESDLSGYTKKEILQLERKREKLTKAIGGILEMADVPDLVFVIDINNELTAVKEAAKLSIPVVAVCDSNVDPDVVDYPIPGNDDSVKSISLFCDLVSKTVLNGMQSGLSSEGFDLNVIKSEQNEIVEISLSDSEVCDDSEE